MFSSNLVNKVRTRALLLALTTFIAMPLTSCSIAKPPDARGRVVDAGGKPVEGVYIAGARVWGFTGYNRSGSGCDMEHITRTDRNGEFVIPGEKTERRRNWNPLSTNYSSGYGITAYKKGMRERFIGPDGLRKEPVAPYTYDMAFEEDPRVSTERHNAIARLTTGGCSCSDFQSAIKEEIAEIEAKYPRKDRPRDHYAVSVC
jgi:hypothetical protein